MFKEGRCPKCHEVIQVPDDREKILCMYCGQEIRVDEALGTERKTDHTVYDTNRGQIMQWLEELVRQCDNPMQNFGKKNYEESFQSFYTANSKMYEAIEQVWQNVEKPDAWLHEIAVHLVETVRTDVESCRTKAGRNQHQIDLNFLASVYLIPTMLKYSEEVFDSFADDLVTMWNGAFGTTIGKASYQKINDGFRRKWCYITTAVCENLGKGNDCYELNLLRDYRDNYLERTRQGHDLVEEYYDIAPEILRQVEGQKDRDRIYKEIYEKYLMPCIREIENREYEACRDRYQEMVLDLKARYVEG